MFGSLQASESEIQRVFDVQVAAWNRGDITSFMRSYEASDDTTFVGQRVLKGYSMVLARYRAQYPDQAAMGQLRFSDLEIRMLGSDYAVATGRFNLTRVLTAGGPATGLFSVILKKIDRDWKIIHDHTSRETSSDQ